MKLVTPFLPILILSNSFIVFPLMAQSSNQGKKIISEDQAIESVRQFCIKTEYYRSDFKSTEFVINTFVNNGYTIDALDLEDNNKIKDVWRIDAFSGAIFVKNANGKFISPVVRSATGTGGYTPWGVAPPPQGSQFQRINEYQGGFTKYESWGYPSGWKGGETLRYYQDSLERRGWKLLSKEQNMHWISMVLLDGGKRYKTQTPDCVARIVTLRCWDTNFELHYEEVNASPSEKSAVIEIYTIATNPSFTQEEKTRRLRIQQENHGVGIFTTAMRYIPIYDPESGQVHTLDTVMRRTIGSMGGTGNTPFERDPLGATVSIIWNPSTDNISSKLGLEKLF